MTSETPKPSMRLRSSMLFGLIGLVALAAACASSEEVSTTVPVADDFATELGAAADELPLGESIALADMTEFEWDRVHIFSPGRKKSLINEAVGIDVYETDLDGRYGLLEHRFLAVYVLDGEVADIGAIPGNFQVLESELASSTATVTREESNDGWRITLGN